MSDVKVIFVGNPMVGDDRIGPYLYRELKNHPELRHLDMTELVAGDILSCNDDELVIIDAVKTEGKIGKVVLKNEDERLREIFVEGGALNKSFIIDSAVLSDKLLEIFTSIVFHNEKSTFGRKW